MKQHITVEQLNELSEKGKQNEIYYRENWYHTIYKGNQNNRWPKEIFWNIGQMIEFLDEYDKEALHKVIMDCEATPADYKKAPSEFIFTKTNDYTGELCDALWEAVKEVLNG